jgi:RloB-like protein
MSRKFNRRPPTRPVGNKILIGCEDKETSPIYFNAIRKSLRLSTERIIVYHPDCTDPLNIVRSVIERRDTLVKDKTWGKTDSAWAVFDGDEHEYNNPTNRLSAIELAQSKDIKLVIVNPSFELWYLLHFQDCFSSIHRDEAYRQLKSHITNYDKSVCCYDNYLQPLTNDALNRAEKIQQQIDRDKLTEYSNPCCSKLPELIKILK